MDSDAFGRRKSVDCLENRNTVLFAPIDTIGHVNSLISIANSLRERGHRTVFLFLSPMNVPLTRDGHEVYDCDQEGLVESRPNEESERKWDKIIQAFGKFAKNQSKESAELIIRNGLGAVANEIKSKDDRVMRKLQLIQPDFIIIDNLFVQPALRNYGKPWARVHSASAISLYPIECGLPYPNSGLPTDFFQNDNPILLDPTVNLEFIQHSHKIKLELHQEWNDYLSREHGFEPTPSSPVSFIHDSPYLNIYMYPQELDYSHVPPPKNWIRCDSILRINSNPINNSTTQKRSEEFQIPESMRYKPGKLIFLSMGSLASANVELMKRLIGILAKSPHRFIVSMGLNADKYELASNMWGEKYVEQLAILPAIDLIITHGGNNTITECFYFGVPGLVVCPVFADQLDNAQRIEECKLGRRLNPFFCTEQQLLSAVEETLADATIRPRMKAISERMQKPDNKFKAINLFRDFVERGG